MMEDAVQARTIAARGERGRFTVLAVEDEGESCRRDRSARGGPPNVLP
jgi:hypothetical protein